MPDFQPEDPVEDITADLVTRLTNLNEDPLVVYKGRIAGIFEPHCRQTTKSQL